MEDDVRINAEQSVEPAEQAAEPAEQVAEPAEQVDGSAEQAAEPAEQAAEPARRAVPSPDWRFGEGGEPPAPTKRKRSGNGGFFAIFGAVFGVCLLLLIGVICLGDGSFQIIRNLKTERVVYVREDDGSSGLLTPNEAADRIAASTVSITVRTADGSGIGSGFVYTADGYILTNHHVIADATSVQVLLPDGMAYDATVVGSDKAGDVAVLKIEATGLIPVQTGSSDDLLVGDELVAVGTPANLNYAGTATFGTVSATARLVPILNTDTGAVEKKMTLIQTDASVNPGNSGGPLADMYGRVVGMVVMKISAYGSKVYEGIGFALPINGVKAIADEIIRSGSFRGDNPIAEGRSLLGLTGHGGEGGKWYSDAAGVGNSIEMSETEKAGYHYMPVSGVYVMEVSGANAAGRLQKGDVITKLNGQNVYATTDLIDIVNRRYAGETVTLTVRRGDATLNVDVVLTEEALA